MCQKSNHINSLKYICIVHIFSSHDSLSNWCPLCSSHLSHITIFSFTETMCKWHVADFGLNMVSVFLQCDEMIYQYLRAEQLTNRRKTTDTTATRLHIHLVIALYMCSFIILASHAYKFKSKLIFLLYFSFTWQIII